MRKVDEKFKWYEILGIAILIAAPVFVVSLIGWKAWEYHKETVASRFDVTGVIESMKTVSEEGFLSPFRTYYLTIDGIEYKVGSSFSPTFDHAFDIGKVIHVIGERGTIEKTVTVEVSSNEEK